MRSTLEQVVAALDELDHFVSSIEPVNTLLKNQKDSVIHRYLNVRRRIDYAAFIVGLYAAFERFVEDLVWSHAELAASSAVYIDLPDGLRGKHLRASAELLARGRLGEGRYAGLTSVDVVSNLHSCLSGTTPYRLNRPAIVQHETNLRAATVHEVFAAVGVEGVNDAARRSQPFLRWYAEHNDIESPPDPFVPATLIELRVNDLVERRNQVAHNGGALTDALGAAEMGELLKFIRAYGHALFTVVAGLYLDRRYVKRSDESLSLGQSLEGPYKDGHVAVVARPACRLAQGQAVLGVTAGRVDRWGVIESLKVDDVAVPAVEASTSSTVSLVGMQLDFKVSDKTKLHVVFSKDELVWA